MKTQHLLATIANRRSVRRFRPDPVPDYVIHQCLEAARWAPSGGNAQLARFGVVTDCDRRQALAEAAGGQTWIAGAPAIIACCARLILPGEEKPFSRQVNELRWGAEAVAWMRNCPEPHQMALVLQNPVPLIPGAHIQLAAASYGVGSCWVGYLDIARCSQILGLPPDYRCYFLIALGYPDEEERQDRLPLGDITFGEEWGEPWGPAGQYPAFHRWVLRPYQHSDESAWLNTWGQVAVTSTAWVVLHHQKPRYRLPSLELVAELNGELVGFLDVEVESKPGTLGYAKDSCCGFVWEYGVRPDCQRRGIGRALVEAARAWLDSRGIRRMEFWSQEPRAQAFYEAMGLTELGRHYQFFMDLPEENLARFQEDGVGLFWAAGHCPLDRFESIRERYRVKTLGRTSPAVCTGYEYRW
ncbi:MAG: GNAT family N-acetyltransferase [Bacillota bacterium]